jgi:hypothetical protein
MESLAQLADLNSVTLLLLLVAHLARLTGQSVPRLARA